MTEIIIGSQYANKVIPYINGAKNSIKIIVFDWRVYPSTVAHPVTRVTAALIDAVHRGVDVKCLVNTSAIVANLRRMGFTAQTIFSDKLVHAKIMIFDDCQAVIGSHNLTQNGLTHNLEVSTIIELAGENNDLSSYFNNLWPISR